MLNAHPRRFLLKVQKRSSGGKIRNCLNLKELTADDSFSLQENNFLKRLHSFSPITLYDATAQKICQAVFLSAAIRYTAPGGTVFQNMHLILPRKARDSCTHKATA